MTPTGRKIIAALDTGNLQEAIQSVERLSPHVGAFKIGHGLTLPNGLSVIETLRNAGASRIFLDLKFHDIPNSVALAVREAAKHGVWMMTIHTSGGKAMMSAAVEEANAVPEESRPLLMGVSVLTSIDEEMLRNDLGVDRTVSDHMLALARMAMQVGIDGLVCSTQEILALRHEFGHQPVIVTPGIRLPDQDSHDQQRVGTPEQALADGADYLVVGRALTHSQDLDSTLHSFGLLL